MRAILSIARECPLLHCPDSMRRVDTAPMTDARDPPPLPPTAPDPEDCCGEGCANCIFDIHERAMTRFEARLAEWQARQATQGSPGH